MTNWEYRGVRMESRPSHPGGHPIAPNEVEVEAMLNREGAQALGARERGGELVLRQAPYAREKRRAVLSEH
jgi:hypothetical protein